MNCKPGDLAYTVGTERTMDIQRAHNVGRVVHVLRYVGWHHFPRQKSPEPDVWVCEIKTPMVDANGIEWSGEVLISDKNLRPIRDQDGEDETLQWAGKPEGVTA